MQAIQLIDINARHIGFFRPQFKANLWQQALDWLVQRSPLPAPHNSI